MSYIIVLFNSKRLSTYVKQEGKYLSGTKYTIRSVKMSLADAME